MSELNVYWNGMEIDVEKCETYVKEMGRKLLKKVFALYKRMLIESKKTPIQKIVASYDVPKVTGNHYGQAMKQVEEKIDAERYIEYVDSCLRKLPGMYQKIIIDSYIRGLQEPHNYMNLELPRSTYYYMKADAVRVLVAEFIALGVENEVKKQ